MANAPNDNMLYPIVRPPRRLITNETPKAARTAEEWIDDVTLRLNLLSAFAIEARGNNEELSRLVYEGAAKIHARTPADHIVESPAPLVNEARDRFIEQCGIVGDRSKNETVALGLKPSRVGTALLILATWFQRCSTRLFALGLSCVTK